jgi:hypothetical protein
MVQSSQSHRTGRSVRDVSYANLEHFLRNKQWKEANEETLLKLLEASGRIETLIAKKRLVRDDLFLLFSTLDAQGRLKILKALAKTDQLNQSNLEGLFQQLTDWLTVPNRLKLLALELLTGLSGDQMADAAEAGTHYETYYEQLRADRSQEKQAAKLFLSLVLFNLINEDEAKPIQDLLKPADRAILNKLLQLSQRFTQLEICSLLDFLSSDELRLLKVIGQTKKQHQRDRVTHQDTIADSTSALIEAPFSKNLSLLLALAPLAFSDKSEPNILTSKPLTPKELSLVKLIEIIEKLEVSEKISPHLINKLLNQLLFSNEISLRQILTYGIAWNTSHRLSKEKIEILANVFYQSKIGFITNHEKQERLKFIQLLTEIEKLRCSGKIDPGFLGELLTNLLCANKATLKRLVDVVTDEPDCCWNSEEVVLLANGFYHKKVNFSDYQPSSVEEKNFIHLLEMIEELKFSGDVEPKDLVKILGILHSASKTTLQQLLNVLRRDSEYLFNEEEVASLVSVLSRKDFALLSSVKALIDQNIAKEIKEQEIQLLIHSLVEHQATFFKVLQTLTSVLFSLPDRLNKKFAKAENGIQTPFPSGRIPKQITAQLSESLSEAITDDRNKLVKLVTQLLKRGSHQRLYAANRPTLQRLLSAAPVSPQTYHSERETQLQRVMAMWQRRSWHLTAEDLEKFPCLDLHYIDCLWRKSSRDRFGFSTQWKVWNETKQTDCHFLEAFGQQVGWRTCNTWLSYEEAIAKVDAANSFLGGNEVVPDGYLPLIPLAGWWCWMGGIEAILQRLSACKVPPPEQTEKVVIDVAAEPASSSHINQSVALSPSLFLDMGK